MAADELKRPNSMKTREGAIPSEGAIPRQSADDDTEGHSMLPNMGVSRELARARERDIQQHLKRHDLEIEARVHKKNAR